MRLHIRMRLILPRHLHDHFADFPFAPEKLALSPGPSVPPKLIGSLHPKEKYVMHYRYLKMLVKYGVKVVRVHRAISFKQSPWMREYVYLNASLRAKAKNKFEKTFFKLMNNSCYGKMLEGARGKKDYRLVSQPHLVQRCINRSTFKSSVLLNEDSNLFLIEMVKTSVRFDRPIICGMTVLDLAKTHMAEFHYGIMKPIFSSPHRIEVVYTDTDSFIYEIKLAGKEKNLYEILAEHRSHFDFSDYPPDHVCYDATNAKILGKFKDEANGQLIFEFIGLRPKLYSLKFFNELASRTHIRADGTKSEALEEFKTIKKAKGVKRNVVDFQISTSHYEEALFHNKTLEVTQVAFQSKKQCLKTVVQRKLALSRNDDKRYILPNQIDTLPWGHYLVPTSEDLVLLARGNNGQRYLMPSSTTLSEHLEHISNVIEDVILHSVPSS